VSGTLQVVAAVVIEDARVLVSRRLATDRFGGTWEFPGGKVEAGESHPEALARELEEELGITVRVEARFGVIRYRSDAGIAVEVHFYRAVRVAGEPVALEVAEWDWAEAHTLDGRTWIPSNREIVRRVVEVLEASG
jgi:(d)CTP diphosphatase